MKNRHGKWMIRMISFLLAAACLGAGAVWAAGDKQDPLVTLSYLTNTVTDEILEQVEEKAERRQKELEEEFDEAIEDFKDDMEVPVVGGSTGGASYTVVTLNAGQQMALGVGCEVMLRVGSASVAADSSPALVDISAGNTLGSGGALTTNHLYMATIAGRTLVPTADTVKVLVRGDYVVA